MEILVPLYVRGDEAEPTILRMVPPADEREVKFGNELLIYADEQGVSNSRGGMDFAVGMEFGTTSIPEAVIQGAQAKRSCRLRDCFDRHNAHTRWPHFLAKDDCRSILTNAIRHEFKDRFFVSVRWHFADARTDHPEGVELNQHLLTQLLGVVAATQRTQKVVLRYEHITGLTEPSMRAWLIGDIIFQIQTMLEFSIPIPFVPIAVQQVQKSDPRVQACDHLLWLENRSLNGKAERVEQAGMRFSDSFEGHPARCRFYGHVDAAFPHPSRRPEPREPGSNDKLAQLMYYVEVNVHRMARDKPPEMMHLEQLFAEASEATLGKTRITFEYYQRLCIAFVTAVDLFCNQRGVTEEQRQAVSDAANFALEMARGREGWCPSAFNFLASDSERAVRSGDEQLLGAVNLLGEGSVSFADVFRRE